MGKAVQLPPWDARWVYVERPETPTQVMSVYVFGPGSLAHAGLDAVLAHLVERAAVVPIFRRRLLRVPLDLDHPYWVVDDSLTIEHHVTSRQIAPGWSSFCKTLAGLAEQPVDLQRPPWHLDVLHGLADIEGVPDGAVAVVQRIHHSATDGLGAVTIARQLFSTGPTSASELVANGPTSQRGAFARGACRIPVRMGRLCVGLASALTASKRSRREAASGHCGVPSDAPRTCINWPVGKSRTFDAVTLQLAEVQAVKAAVGGDVTINDVMLSVIGGALSKYLTERGDLLDQSLVAMVPRSIHGGESRTFGNHFTSMLVSMRTDVNDPVERAHGIRTSFDHERRRKDSEAVRASERLTEFVPGFILRLLVRTSAKREPTSHTVAINTVVSNIPRGQGIQLFGAPAVTTFEALGLEDGHGLVHTISSIGDVLTVSVTAEPKLVPDLDRYVSLIGSEFQDFAHRVEK